MLLCPREARREAKEPENKAGCGAERRCTVLAASTARHGAGALPQGGEQVYGISQACPTGLPKAPPQDGATPQSLCHGPLSSPGSLAANSSFWKMKSGTGKTASYTIASAPRNSCESHNVSLGGAPTFPTEVVLTKG